MRKKPLYSSTRARAGKVSRDGGATPGVLAPAPMAPEAPKKPGLFSRLGQLIARHDRIATLVTAVAFTLGAIALYDYWQTKPVEYTQEDIDDAVMHTIATHQLPSEAARAFQKVHRSVVMVRGIGTRFSNEEKKKRRRKKNSDQAGNSDPKKKDSPEHDHDNDPNGVGTGVVLVDDGIILTNLHVVRSSRSLRLTFFDGSESAARVIDVQPENDLAILKAARVPDDLPAATVRSTADLKYGDRVIAVGFPFGIGPSVSSGIISGLKREFQTPVGSKTLKNLIQFDAAANPGNSGGPLVTMDGSVVGIVTAILNPSEHRTFAGIGFAVPIEQAAGGAGPSPF